MEEKLIKTKSLDQKIIHEQQEYQLRDTDSQQQEFQRQENQLQNIIDKKRNAMRMTSKIIVGNRSEYDMTEFFQFKHKQEKYYERPPSIINQLKSDYLSWLVLIYALVNGAAIPPWIGTIQTCKYFRNSWLFFVKSILIIPFVMFEKRTCSPQQRQKFSWKYISTLTNLRKIYWSAASTTITHVVLWTCFQWTYRSHALILGGLSNFFLSISRCLKKQNHRVQPGGQIIVVIGILFMLTEVYTMDVGNATETQLSYRETDVYFREGYQRVLADLIAIMVSFITAQISKVNIQENQKFPPFLSLMLVNILVSFSTATAGFFMSGGQFSFTPKWGWFSLFTNEYFSNFLFECSLFSFGVFMTYALIAKLFPNPTIPAIVMILDPFVSSFFFQIAGTQHMPGQFSTFGFMLIIPGMILILVGQYLVVEQQKKQPIPEILKLQKVKSQHEQKRLTRKTIKQMRQNSTTAQRLDAVMLRLKSKKNSIQLPQIEKTKSFEMLFSPSKTSLAKIDQQQDVQEDIDQEQKKRKRKLRN